MVMARLLSPVAVGEDIYAYQPATDPGKVTLGYVLGKLNSQGANGFIPGFQKEFADIIKSNHRQYATHHRHVRQDTAARPPARQCIIDCRRFMDS